MLNRLIVLAVLAAVLSDAGSLRAQTSNDAWFTLSQVAPNVWAAVDNPNLKQRSYANAGVIIGDDGVVVVDTMTGDDAAARLLQETRRLTTLPLKFVVNTHYHGDHVAGNRLFADAGARVLAHRNVRTWIQVENIRMLGDKPNPDLVRYIERFASPTITYSDALDVHAGSRLVQVRAFPGHTGGDSVVIVPDARVVFAGDLVWKDTIPNTIDGTTKAWIQTLDALVSGYPGYTFIPGHGGIATTHDVVAFRDYLAMVQTFVSDARASGKSGEALVQTVMPLMKEKYGHLELFDYLVPRNLAEAEAEQSGRKRVPQP